jgi:D-alanine-D-alanine ligase
MKVAVIGGGRSPERDVSERSAQRAAAALEDTGWETRIIDPAQTSLVEAVRGFAPALCYLTLHGKEGEDGTVQRVLDLLGVPYTGSAALDCEAAFDKVLEKDILARAGVRTPRWAVVEAASLRDLGAGAAMDRVEEIVGLPCVVKPSRSGSALGVGVVTRTGDLAGAMMSALSYSDAVIVEAKVEGTEVSVGVIGDPPTALPAVEVVPKDGLYDYVARYTSGMTEYFAPARLGPEVSLACVDSALGTTTALRLRSVSRVDMIIDRAGLPWVLEANVSPGLTETSLLPMGASAAGMSISELCDLIARSALGPTREPDLAPSR